MRCRIRNILVFLLSINTILIRKTFKLHWGNYTICELVLSALIFYVVIKPLRIKSVDKEVLKILNGYELIIDCAYTCIFESLIYLFIFLAKTNIVSSTILLYNLIFGLEIIIIVFLSGYFRAFYKKDINDLNKKLLLILWCIPFFNIIVVSMLSKRTKLEYHNSKRNFYLDKIERETDICKTKYPIVFVHGIFARDWMLIDYWGRIPRELMKNGALIYYGKQESANSIEESAVEIKNNIMKIIKGNNYEKVNIIAHSKGGLDCRYAISVLGLSKYTASLTTINTPHKGCKYLDFLLNKIPNNIKQLVARKYNKMFKKLGDKNPDFLSGVEDLKASKCREFNKKVIDSEDVYYQSVTSKMNNMFGARFPLNIGYLLAKRFEGENDGLVSVESSKHGKFLGVITSKHKGISHADAVDMCCRDIGNFNVCKFYIDLVKDLKEMGF